jgi:nuclear pore complex protein Nup155
VVELPPLQEVVVAVTLMPPNRELFSYKIEHLLVIATGVDVRIMGVSLLPHFRLVATEIAIPTEEALLDQFQSLPHGKIVMGGSDGRIIELAYKPTSWFSASKRYKKSDKTSSLLTAFLPSFLRSIGPSRILQFAYDASRLIFYALCETSERSGYYRIDVYDLSRTGAEFKKVSSIEGSQLLQRLREQNPKLSNLYPERLHIVSIAAIERSLALESHLLAVTRNGIRVYLTFFLAKEDAGDDVLSWRPTPEFAIIIKLPPAIYDSAQPTIRALGASQVSPKNTLPTTTDKPSSYEQSIFLKDGSLVLVETQDTVSKLLVIRRSLARIALQQTEKARCLMEPYECVSCINNLTTDTVCAMAELPPETLMDQSEAQLCGYISRGEFREAPPVRYFGDRPGAVSFISMSSLVTPAYKPSCQFLMLSPSVLTLYCEVRPIDLLLQALMVPHPNDWDLIRTLVERYGSVHVCAMLVILIVCDNSNFLGEHAGSLKLMSVSQEAKTKATSIFKHLGTQRMTEARVFYTDASDPLMALAEYQSLYLATARLLRVLWFEPISYFEDVTSQLAQFSSKQLEIVRSRVNKLLEFITNNYRDSTYPPAEQLKAVLTRSVQSLYFLALLGHNLSYRRCAYELTPEEQQALAGMNFRDVVCSSHGHSLVKSLIETYVQLNKTSRQAQSADLLERLSISCSSYFNAADAEIFTGKECLKKAAAERDLELKASYVQEGLKRIMKNAASVSLPKVVAELRQLHEFGGCVRLCLQKAKEVKEMNGPQSDVEESYQVVFDLLIEIEEALRSEPSEQMRTVPRNALELIRTQTIEAVLKVDDMKLHWALFDLLNMVKPTDLVGLKSPYLANYLSNRYSTKLHPHEPLLARHSLKSKDYRTSYKEFGRLASVEGEVPLELRLEYLEMSLVSLDKFIESLGVKDPERQKCLQERDTLEFNLQLAKLQTSLKKQLHPNASGLDSTLLSARQLYADYAKAYNLYETQLDLLYFMREQGGASANESLLQAMKSLFVPVLNQYIADLPRLKDKLEELVRKFPFALDVKAVVERIESEAIKQNQEHCWLVETLAKLPGNTGYAAIFGVYRAMWESVPADSQAAWILALRLEMLLQLWFKALDTGLVSDEVWKKPADFDKANVLQFIEAIPALEQTFTELISCCSVMSSSRRARLERSVLSLEDRFKELKARHAHGERLKQSFVKESSSAGSLFSMWHRT